MTSLLAANRLRRRYSGTVGKAFPTTPADADLREACTGPSRIAPCSRTTGWLTEASRKLAQLRTRV